MKWSADRRRRHASLITVKRPWLSTARSCLADHHCRDERNHIHLDRPDTELLFQIPTEREERAVVVNRLTFRALIMETGSVDPVRQRRRFRDLNRSARRGRLR